MSSEYAIEVNDLGKCYQIYDKPSDRLKQMLFRGRRQCYKEFWALKDVSFKVKKGETVGIIGRNGSGKSTLLQMICGTLNPTVGQIKVNGKVAALLELGAGFNPEFTGVENVYMAASLYGLSKEETDQRFNAISTFADIADHIYQPVKTYSSGMYVRLAFAVIAHVDAEILVIDEALAVGDAFFTQKCMRFLRAFMKTGTVLFVSHDTASVINLCDQGIWLHAGNLRQIGVPKVVAQDYLAELYNAEQDEKTSEINGLPENKLLNHKVDSVPMSRDMRQDFINSTEYRNDIQIFEFDQTASDFGRGGGKIVSVKLLDVKGNALKWIVGGEFVQLRVLCRAETLISEPIIGFYLNDRLGQNLFGDNTCRFSLDSPIQISQGQKFEALFEFCMPILPVGDYSFTVALAEGSQANHIQHHWIHDALVIRSQTTSVSAGLMGVPMNKIKLTKYE